MFTGIIEEIGKIEYIKRGTKSATISIHAESILDDVKVGDSVAVNGVCLTATTVNKTSFTADVMAETMRRSSLSSLTAGSLVNLERAMPMNGRFGGHIVSGHIDGTGVIDSFKREENAIWVTVNAEPKLLKYIVEKGSIAIDGVSLTVAYVDDRCFKVSLIPHTSDMTILTKKKVGDKVNLENDIVGKYVEKLMSTNSDDSTGKNSGKSSGLSKETLFANGFM